MFICAVVIRVAKTKVNLPVFHNYAFYAGHAKQQKCQQLRKRFFALFYILRFFSKQKGNMFRFINCEIEEFPYFSIKLKILSQKKSTKKIQQFIFLHKHMRLTGISIPHKIQRLILKKSNFQQ